MSATHISIPLAIVIGLIASFVQSLGLTIQRKSHVLNQLLPEHKQRVEHRRPLWLLGFTIFISSNILGSLVQIASLPVVILAPLGAVSLLWNAFFARFLLGDVFSLWMVLGTLFIAGGAVLIAVFGIVPEPTRSLEDLLELFRRPTFIAYFSVLGTIVFVCLVITHITEYSLSRQSWQAKSSLSSRRSSVSDNILDNTSSNQVPNTLTEDTLTTERTPLLNLKSSTSNYRMTSIPHQHPRDHIVGSFSRTRLLLAVSYASSSGIISGMCLLFAKSGVELLLLTLRGNNQFWRWQAWVLVLGLLLFALLQLWYLHKALILADPTLVCPSAFCFYNLSSIINGLVYFDQFSLIPPLHLMLVVLGIIVLLGGVWSVSIQSGGGGVDVGPWSQKNDDDTIDALVDDFECGTSLANDVAMDSSNYCPDRDGGKIASALSQRGTRSESDVVAISSDSSQEPNFVRDLGLDYRPCPQADGQSTSLRGAESLSSGKPRIDHQRRPTCYHPSRTTAGTSHTPNDSPLIQPSLSVQTSSTVSSFGAGFQIGLSPVSPGFAIVPRERRRRVSGHGLGMIDANTDETGYRERHRRRTLSEGDFRRRSFWSAQGQGDGEQGLEEGLNEESEGDIGEDSTIHGKGTDTDNQGKMRWEWLRKVFIGQG